MSKIHTNTPEKDFTNYQGETYKTEIVDLIGIQRLIRKHLYTKPIQTPVQEMLCNALDAMEMSGKENQPIKVFLPDLSDGLFKIRDFGPGLTDEQVKKIYANIGVSTKRKNKKAIGCWGYGSKSLFAYTSNFFVISYYNGVETTFLAKINPDDSSSFEIKHKAATSEPNGLEIQCPVKDADINKFCESVVRCCFFWKVKPLIFGDAWKEKAEKLFQEVNNPIIKLKKGRAYHFSDTLQRILGIREDVIVNAGYIPYNLLDSVLEQEKVKALNKNKNLTLVLDFDIEDLMIPPGREFLEDKPENVALLSENYVDCLTEYEEFFYHKVQNFSDLKELQEAATGYFNNLTDNKRDFLKKIINFNGYKYFINKNYKLKWDCSEYNFLVKKTFEKNVSFGYGEKRRSKRTSDFGLDSADKLEELDYNCTIPSIVYLSAMWSDTKQKSTVKKILENTGNLDHLFYIEERPEQIIYTFRYDNISLPKQINDITIRHILDTTKLKLPKKPNEKKKTLAKICKVHNDNFWFDESESELESLQDQIVAVFHGNYKLHFKYMKYTEKQAIMEMKRIYKEKNGKEIDIYFISSGVEKKLKKLKISFKPLNEEMKNYLTPEMIEAYRYPIQLIKIPALLKQIGKLSFLDKLNFPQKKQIKEVLNREESLFLLDQEYRSKKYPTYILEHLGYSQEKKEALDVGYDIEVKLWSDYPLFIKMISSHSSWIEEQGHEEAQKQLIKAWNDAIKEKNDSN